MPRENIDCAIVIALREEFVGGDPFHGLADFFELKKSNEFSSSQNFQFTDSKGIPRRGLAVVMEEMSPLSAYEACRDLLDNYNPTLIVNTGLAGALSKDLRLGDVVIADEVDAYDYRGKAVTPPTDALAAPDGFVFRWGGRTLLPSSEPRQALNRIWQVETIYDQWQTSALNGLNKVTGISVPDLLQRGYLRDRPRVEHGLIASGNTVSASAAFKKSLLDSRNRLFLAIEMESAGALRATTRLGYRSLVVKAISDLADDNKEQLDRSTSDLMRAWAMSNAYHLLSIACREILNFEVERTVKTASQHLNNSLISEERNRLLDFSLKHFKKQHRSLLDNIDASLTIYDRLFRFVVESDRKFPNNLFLDLAAAVVASSHPYPLRVDGKPGTGKTTFLTLLYLAIRKVGEDDPKAPVPIYVNLRRYTTPERGRERQWMPRTVAEDDLALLRRLLERDPALNIVILLDGIEEYVRLDDAIERTVLDLVANCSTAKKIVGLGINYLSNRERFTRTLQGDLNSPEQKVILGSVAISDADRLATFIEVFHETYNIGTPSQVIADVLVKADLFRLSSLDLLTLSMLFESVTDGSRYAAASNLGDFLKIYCEDFLQTSTGAESLDDAAQLAFDYTVKPQFNLKADGAIFRRSWKLLHLHSSIRDFLVAWHTVQLVRKVGMQSDQSRVEDLDYVYPHSINRFCKDIVNASRDSQFEVIEGAKRIFRERGHNAKPHAAYLAGRVSDFSAREQARAWLRAECLPEVDKIQLRRDSDLSSSELLLCRTVYISLTVLHDRAASEAYIKLLLERPAWNEINRGFHLEYYGDIPFDPERQLSHSDGLAPFPKTFENLYGRVAANFKNPNYGLLDVEIFTLFSLAQFRYLATDQLETRVRFALVELIPQLLPSRHLSETVREYVKMLEVNLRDPKPFLPGKVVEKLYGMKTNLRAGWVDRKLPLTRIESIADHTYGALLLGIVFLPEDNLRGWGEYSKQMVLKYLIIHDLGESIAGDASPFDVARYRAIKEKERDAYHYLMMCRTYPGIANLAHYHSLWEAFEKGADEKRQNRPGP